MVQSISIKNFKSVVDLSLDLGYFNVLIGENGCGKSNILEAIAFAGASSANKLDFEFLGSRGIRVTNPEFMFSAFSNGKKEKSIEISVDVDREIYKFDLTVDEHNSKKWMNRIQENAIEKVEEIFNEDKNKEKYRSSLVMSIVMSQLRFMNQELSNYLVYSLEESKLREFSDTKQIYPLGIKGEGLFQYLKELILSKKNAKIISQIKDNLSLLDWYEDFDLPRDLMSNEFSLKIKDKYLYEKLQYFDQRSTNEGFLYLLFYSTLFISKDTPSFFAIDNIDASFNPKMCTEMIRSLASLAKKHKKQVILTTHNPAILDGLNLKDEGQRLFVVRRNDEGHTKAKRIEYKADRKMRLSEIWTNGFIGGLPENF